jgi:hypothetical protein
VQSQGALDMEAWEDLSRRASAPPWFYPQWVLPWHESFAEGRLEIVTVSREGRLVGVLPLQRRRGELRSTANGHTPEFGALVADEDAGAALANKVARSPARRVATYGRTGPSPSSGAGRCAGAGIGCWSRRSNDRRTSRQEPSRRTSGCRPARDRVPGSARGRRRPPLERVRRTPASRPRR